MDPLFLRACRGEVVERTPIWIMRQAGRYLPEYREVRKQYDFWTVCSSPELAVKVTLQPIERFGFDASIVFSDILVPARPMGFQIDFKPGPVLENPVRDRSDVARVRIPDVDETVPFVFEAIRELRRELPPEVPLIGFAAAPFTLATYLVQGGGSKQFEKIKGLIFDDPEAAHELLDRIARVTEQYLLSQIDAGAQAIQLFDSWAGLLGPAPYREFALRYARRILDRLADRGVPRIYFAPNAAHVLPLMRSAGADVIGVDWRVGVDDASRELDHRYAIQGNLDPTVLLSNAEQINRHTAEILDRGRAVAGHIFNLGHGILPMTPVENVETLVRSVRLYGASAN